MRYLLLLLLAFSTIANGQTAQDYINKANEAIENNASTYSITKHINKALKLEPNNESALYLNAKVLSKAKHYKDALKALNSLISLNETVSKYYFLRSEVYAKLGQRNYELEAGVNKAIADLDKMISLGADTKDVYYRKGKLYELLGVELSRNIETKGKALNNFKLAKTAYNKTLELDSSHQANEDLKFLLPKIEQLNKA